VIVIVKNVNINASSTAPDGAVYAAVVLNNLIRDALDAVLDGFDISIYDLNATTSERFLYTSAAIDNTKNGTHQNEVLIANAEYTFSTLTTFADRTLQLTIIPNDAYKQKYNGTTKVIAISISLVLMVILLIGCVFLYFARKLLIAKRKRAEAHVQIDLLKTNQSALRTLLDRIASQESKTRAVINSLPDAVCVISPTGKILQTNSAFDNEFPFSQQEMEKGVYTWDVFTELSSDFFRVFDESKEIETQAARRFGDMIEVLIRVRDLRGRSGESSTSQSNDVKPSGMTSLQLQELEEAYVIIAKNISIKHIQHETNTQERVQRHDFERKFRDKEFREELRNYCEKNKNVENILFLEQVKEYKKAQFGTRVDMKMAIFERFIKPDAPMQLNLANEVVLEESIKINKSMGDVDVFRNVEENVLKTLANDIYPRYLMDQRKASVGDLSQ
jgi:PAS domain S-box-containing protein